MNQPPDSDTTASSNTVTLTVTGDHECSVCNEIVLYNIILY